MRVHSLLGLAVLLLAGCGGGNPADNPDTLVNGASTTTNQRLSFAYFQYCVEPILNAQLPILLNGTTTNNTCAGSGCHAAATGTGGAFRIVPNAPDTPLDGTDDEVRASDMYKNFYSAQSEVVVGSPAQSRLLLKPQLLNVLHGGGLIFASVDKNVETIEYWISHPEPKGTTEFNNLTYSAYFTSGVPPAGVCITQ
jgi:hypothetical protein